MNLNYMKEDAVTQLRENMMSNVNYYKSGEDWVDSYLKDTAKMENWLLESRISYQIVELKTDGSDNKVSKTDAENAKRIHKSLKTLTPAQAVDPRIWTYLTHVVYREYMAVRWLSRAETARGTLQRYFASTNRELIRNGIARLWWYGYLTYDATRDEPYELTDFLLSNQNIAQALLERKLGDNKQWLINMLDIVFKYKNDYPEIMISNNIKELAKYLNFSGGVTVLDCLSKDATESFFLKWVQKKGFKKEEVLVI
ncbi:DUF6339 family protein [Bacillus spizizenii]|uniref:DUF6339 family protein n=1 Tax=Bacillus spizizenii TaxID=96241 RepID=A0A9Q4DS40_BACSC|nr:hypothetical protein JN25_01635 [Bacillus sp. BSC154]MCY7829788.1 DUF6339 family protein [Bacillus spizizenii]MCY7842562.1 DUF6339 family protein [Bacillus spizizenii]MCY8123160.1 DUF6339 family protein [Bacillus spizizenii]MCY8899664.1 DUF6339 family protein [Bacillus spizizenii]